MAKVELVKVKEIDDGMRLNRWFLKYYPDLPLSGFQKLLRTKQIKVDGKRAEAGLKLVTGQEVRVPPLGVESKELGIEKSVSDKDAKFIQSMVIFKDKNIIVLNKTSGIAVQGGTNTTRHIDGMLDALKFGLEERPRLVHRIDKDTSGILVLARNRKTADVLTKGFREHKIKKTYLALVVGCPKKNNGEINAPLEKVGEKSIVVEGGDKAVTTYKVLESVGDKFALVEASPMTGRTHQIRAHMEYLGTPIVGDNKYFIDKRKKFEMIEDKLHLHAYKVDLSFAYDIVVKISAPVPDFFSKSLNYLGIEGVR